MKYTLALSMIIVSFLTSRSALCQHPPDSLSRRAAWFQQSLELSDSATRAMVAVWHTQRLRIDSLNQQQFSSGTGRVTQYAIIQQQCNDSLRQLFTPDQWQRYWQLQKQHQDSSVNELKASGVHVVEVPGN